MSKLAITTAIALAACTPGQHAAYQYTMGGVAMAGFVTASVITVRTLEKPNTIYGERSPMFGLGPRPFVVVCDVINLAAVLGIRHFPENRGAAEGVRWVKSITMTMMAAYGAFDAWNDYSLTRH